jgi:hypothetical protein
MFLLLFTNGIPSRMAGQDRDGMRYAIKGALMPFAPFRLPPPVRRRAAPTSVRDATADLGRTAGVA